MKGKALNIEKILKNTVLFQGIDEETISSLITHLKAKVKRYSKREYILHAGYPTTNFGLVLNGSVLILRDDFWGNRSILGEALQGDLFAETFACNPQIPISVSVVAAQDCEILFLQMKNILGSCTCDIHTHTKISQNLLAILAMKNLMLTKKIEHMSKRTTRQKVMSYLSDCRQNSSSDIFQIPFNRQELADYLSVDRSALSAELSKLQNEGFISYQKDHFKLIK